jgi:NAD(P)-dependent dehydrogenase (short-subunit alcohol dehydrogenase family)
MPNPKEARMGRLDGRVAIVSGGGTGIGAATARLFASEGAKVVVTGRRPEPIEAVAAEVDGRAVAGDTSDDEHVRDAVATAVESLGGLDVVVANAGLGFGGATADVDDEHWQRTLDVNLTGAFRLARAAIPSLIQRGGGSAVPGERRVVHRHRHDTRRRRRGVRRGSHRDRVGAGACVSSLIGQPGGVAKLQRAGDRN